MRALKDVQIYVLGEVLSKALPFFLLPYVAQSLGVEEFGRLAYYLAIGSILTVFLGISANSASARYFYRYGHRSISLVIYASVLHSLGSAFVLVLLGVLLEQSLFVFAVLLACSNSLLMLQLSLRQCQKQALPYFYISFGASLFSLLLVVALFELLSPSIENRLIGTIFVQFVFALFFLWRSQQKNALKTHTGKRRLCLGFLYIYSYGFPLIFHHLALLTKGSLDRVLVESLFDDRSLGLYSAAFQLITIIAIFKQAVNRALTPYFYEALKDQKISQRHVIVLTLCSVLIFPALICFTLYFVPEAAYVAFLGPDFLGVKSLVDSFALGVSLQASYIIIAGYLFYHAKTQVLALANVVSAVIHVLFVWFLAAEGISAIPFALVVSNLVLILFLIYAAMRYKLP